MNKRILNVVLLLLLITAPGHLHAYETWNTPSGKSYDVYVSVKVKGQASPFYIISYKTSKRLNDSYGLLMESYDLLTYLYYFQLDTEMKKNKTAGVTIEAFNTVPISDTDKQPSWRITKSLPQVKEIVLKHKKTDQNRLRAFLSLKLKKYKSAFTYFDKIKKKVAHDYVLAANAHLYNLERKVALETLQEGIKTFPKNVLLLNNLAMATFLRGSFHYMEKFEYGPKEMKEAKKILAGALELDKNNWLTNSNMGTVERALGNIASAEKFYLTALKLSDNNPDLLFQVASSYEGQKKMDKAKTTYRAALRKLEQGRTPASSKRVEEIKEILKRLSR